MIATGAQDDGRIRVLVVDDHAVFRSGLEHLIAARPELLLVGAVPDGGEVVDAVLATAPDVVLMDLSMPGVDGVTATRLALDADPGVRVVALTSFADSDLVLRALDAGAVGYLLKDTSPDDLVAGIRAAHRGESPLAPLAAQALVRERLRRRAEVALSPREREVLDLVVEGLANKQIARRLDISEATVKAHVSHILATTGAKDRTQAALWARRHGAP